MKVAISTLGCKVNQFDSDVIAGLLKEQSLEVVSFKEHADAYIVNTCTVTSKTDYQSRQLIRRARKLNPSAIIIVTGCYAQVASKELTDIKGIDYVLGNLEKETILTYIKMGGKRDSPLVSIGNVSVERSLSYSRGVAHTTRTRAYLKIQDGCDTFCSFCIIPYVRGRSRSLPSKRIFEEMDYLMGRGFKEVILTGIHLGSYGVDLSPSMNLTDLLKEMERRVYPCRIRLSSLEPKEITPDLIGLLGESTSLCNHIHIPLQSGDNHILSRMNRHYTSKDFESIIERLYNTIPDIAIGIDVIAGFPGEEERNFLNTFNLLRGLPLAYFHVFSFSRRKGTPAAEFSSQVEKNVVRERARRLRELGMEKKMNFYRRNKGKTVEVLIETTRENDTRWLKGFSRNYIPVSIEGDGALKGREVPVRLGGFLRSKKRVGGKLLQEKTHEK